MKDNAKDLSRMLLCVCSLLFSSILYMSPLNYFFAWQIILTDIQKIQPK